MFKRIAVLAMFLVTAGTFGLRAQSGYEIKVKVNGVADSTCYLANYFGDKQYLRDSCNADKTGNFVFKGEKPLEGGIYLVVVTGRRYFEILVDRQQHFSIETDMNDFVGAFKVKGSPDNQAFYQYLQFIGSKSKEIEPLRKAYEVYKDDPVKSAEIKAQMAKVDTSVFDFRSDFIKKHPDVLITKVLQASDEIKTPEPPLKPDGTRDSAYVFYWYKEHYFDNIDLKDDRMLRTPVFHPKLEQYMTKLTIQIADSINKAADDLIAKLNPGSEMFKYVVWWITNHYETSKIMGLDAVFVHMVRNYYTKEKAFWVDDTQLFKIQDRANSLEPILIGKKVKNLILADSLGKYHALYDVKAKYTVLYFWDPDCGHCQKVTPHLKEIIDNYKGESVQVYAVCTEVEMDKWKKFINEKQLNGWIHVADPKLKNNFRHDFDIQSTPQIFLLNENKEIIAKKIEADTLDEILKKEMAKDGMPSK